MIIRSRESEHEDNQSLLDEVRIYVTKSPYVNAFSTDQGVIMINIGLIAQLENEAQLAYAVAQNACLFTRDDDLLTIADNWQKIGKEHSGIIFVHQERLSIGEIISRIKLIVDILSPEEMKNHIEFL